MATIPFQQTALVNSGNVRENLDRQIKLGLKCDSASMREVMIAWQWLRTAVLGAGIAMGALIMLFTGYAGAGAVFALAAAIAGAAIARLAFRRACAAFDGADGPRDSDSAPANGKSAGWVSIFNIS